MPAYNMDVHLAYYVTDSCHIQFFNIKIVYDELR